MPNWAESKVTLIGNKDDIQIIYDTLNPLELTLKNLYPEPDLPDEVKPSELNFDTIFTPEYIASLRGDRDFKYTTWMNWRIAHWGSKWDITNGQIKLSSLENGASKLELEYLSAWSPVTRFWEKISQDFPKLIIREVAVEEGTNAILLSVFTGGIKTVDISREATNKDYEKAGVVLEADGSIDWEKDHSYDLLGSFES